MERMGMLMFDVGKFEDSAGGGNYVSGVVAWRGG